MYLSGFSLGANVCLKYLGELGEEAEKLNIMGGAVTCVPFDPVASQGKLDVGFNRAVYSENFLLTLKVKAQRKILRFPNSFDYEKVKQCSTIGEFDDCFIAKIYGFEDKIDYYKKTGSKWFLEKIKVPTIAINAKDDPFIEESSLPSKDDIKNSPVRCIYHDNGGHCGFIGESNEHKIPTWGFIAEELGRIIDHISMNTCLTH
jgi:predicted alpha/beta-fold hydrolase